MVISSSSCARFRLGLGALAVVIKHLSNTLIDKAFLSPWAIIPQPRAIIENPAGAILLYYMREHVVLALDM